MIRSATSAADEAIVRSICALAHSLGLIAVAEGVEDEECGLRLAGYDVDLLQGYHFSRPLAETDLLMYVCRDDASALLDTAPLPSG